MEVTRIFDLLPYYAETHPSKNVVLAGKEDEKWVTYNIHQYREIADQVSYGLLNLGIAPGDTVATVISNSPEWNFLDIGIMQMGAVHVPIYPTISDSDFLYILNHAEIKAIFIAGEELYKKIERVKPLTFCLENVFVINPIDQFHTLKELTDSGKQNPDPERLAEIKSGIKENDLVTLIYTSGTTGNPKGVMLSHRNLLSNMEAVHHIPKMGAGASCISFLPLSHVYERVMNYVYQYLGISIYYVESLATITENIQEISPDMMCAVPRFLEKVYDKIIATGRKLPWIKKRVFFWALHLAQRFEIEHRNGSWYHFQLWWADLLVFRKWRNALGNKLQLIVSGGAALQPRLSRVFWAAGIEIYEGYGLTETSPVIAVSTREKGGITFGCVGPVLKNVTVKIPEDGEVLCKGPNVMLGYYKDTGMTREIIDEEGWLHTGDVGIIEPNGHLRISGRKKEIFKTSNGKYIAPQVVENKMKESPFIDNIMVVGENRKFAAALIAPNFEYLRSWCQVKGVEYSTDQEMARNPLIRKRIQKEVEIVNETLGSTEQIKKFALMPVEWSIDEGELTPSLKLKRDLISLKYQDTIERLFE
ncbi:MAG: long-chain fatty acid--CoA ligase [Bacteroidetes bacterium]|nr:long-chain fatty acid--CoA ligase [Bacteroidota bacterium]